MGKVIVLILLALGAKANAEDTLSILVDRASGNIEGMEVDLDEATMAKPAKASGGVKTAAAPRTAARKTTSSKKRGAVGPRKGSFTPIAKRDTAPKKVFGGTNLLMAGEGKAIQQRPALPTYWGGTNDLKGLGFGWSMGGKKVNTVTKETRQVYQPPSMKGKFNAFKGRDTAPKKLFGGTNTLMAGKGQAIQETPATPSYWGGRKSDKGLGYGWFQTKAKAVPDAQTLPFMAQPAAPRVGLARPQITMGGRPMSRPFLLESQTRDIALSDIVFFVGALFMISFVVLKISRRGALAKEQATYVALSD